VGRECRVDELRSQETGKNTSQKGSQKGKVDLETL
jgi:hypothetical protein